MDNIRESWDKVIVFYKDHKLIVIVSGIFVVVLAILGIILVFSGGSSPPSSPATPVTPAAPAEIPTTDLPDTSDVSDEDDQDSSEDDTERIELEISGAFLGEDAFADVVADFESENENVTINYNAELISNNDKDTYQSRLLSDLEDGNGADIFLVDSGWAGSFAPFAAPAPSALISANEVSQQFGTFVATDFVYDDAVYGLPYAVDNLAIIYNTEMWSDAGLTTPASDWETFLEEQITVLNDYLTAESIDAAAISVGGDNSEFNYELFVTLLLQNQIPISVDGQVDLGDETTVNSVVSFYSELRSVSGWSDNYNLDIAAFLEAKLATYIAPSWRLNDIVRYNDLGNLGLEFAVSELPQVASNQSNFANFASYWGLMVNRNTENPEAAWEFLNFLMNEDNLELVNDVVSQDPNTPLGFVYSLESLSSSQSTDQYLEPYALAIPYTVSFTAYDESEIKPLFLQLASGQGSVSDIELELESLIEEYEL